MALGTHEIPVLIELGPVQHVVVLDFFVGIEMEPALAALVFRPAVPGDRKRLYAAVREFDQVLLEGIDAEGVFDLERRKLAVGPVGLNEELFVFLEETGLDAVMVEPGVIEIAEHGSVRGVLHGMLVLGLLPKRCFGLVAIGASFTADKGGGRGGAAAIESSWQYELALGKKHKDQSTDRESRYGRKSDQPWLCDPRAEE